MKWEWNLAEAETIPSSSSAFLFSSKNFFRLYFYPEVAEDEDKVMFELTINSVFIQGKHLDLHVELSVLFPFPKLFQSQRAPVTDLIEITSFCRKLTYSMAWHLPMIFIMTYNFYMQYCHALVFIA